MMRDLTIATWNVKGIKMPKKASQLWHVMRKRKEVTCWCIQEHHVNDKALQKQALRELLSFYATSSEGERGVCTTIHRDLEPKEVFQQVLEEL